MTVCVGFAVERERIGAGRRRHAPEVDRAAGDDGRHVAPYRGRSNAGRRADASLRVEAGRSG